MNIKITNWKSVATIILFGLVLLSATLTPLISHADQSHAVQRPIEEFVEAQGTFCLDLDGVPPDCDLFVPPSPNMEGWTVQPEFATFALVDYAGLANNYLVDQGGSSLGTTFQGSVTERPLEDGRAEVSVKLHTKNALVWVSDIRENFPGELLFGHRVDEVLGGARPALAECSLHFVFINTAPDAPLPDLMQLEFAPEEGQEFKFKSFYARGTGQLADGSAAEVVIVQTGVFGASGQGAITDLFPAERIDLHRIGK